MNAYTPFALCPDTPPRDVLAYMAQGRLTRPEIALQMLVAAFPADARSDDETKAWNEAATGLRDMWLARQDHFAEPHHDSAEGHADWICKAVWTIAEMNEGGV